MNALVLLLGCSDGGPLNKGNVATYDLTLTVLEPTNQSPLAGLDTLTLVLEHAAGEPEEYELSSTSGSPQITGLGDLEDTVLALQGWSGDTLVSFGRSEPVTAHDEQDLQATMLVSEVDSFGWLTLLDKPLAQGTLVADGQGTFWLFGGDRGSYRVSGAGGSNPQAGVMRLDLAPPEEALAFTEAGSLPSQESEYGGSFTERIGMSGTLLTGTAADAGLVLLAGGHQGDIDFTTTTDNALLFDPSDGSFTELDVTMKAARTYHLAVEMANGDVAFFGGWGSDENDRALPRQEQIEIYRRAERKFEKAGTSYGYGPGGMAASAGGSGALACGGFNSGGGDTWFSVDGCTLTSLTGETADVEVLPSPLTWGSMVSLGDDRVLLTGGVEFDGIGQNESVTATDASWIYDPANDSWTDAGTMAEARVGHSTVLLPDGRVLAVGGSTHMGVYDADSDWGGSQLACAEVWTEGSGWSAVGSCSSGGDLAEAAYWPMVAADPAYGVLSVGGLGEDNSPTQSVSLWGAAP